MSDVLTDIFQMLPFNFGNYLLGIHLFLGYFIEQNSTRNQYPLKPI